MKKTVFVLSLILLGFSNLNAQWFFNKTIKGNGNVITETRKTNDYKGVQLSGFFDVTLVEGKEGNITVKAEENLMDYIIVDVVNDVLKITLKKGITLKTKKGIFITVPIEQISKIVLNGSGDITSNTIIDTNTLAISLSGSGDIVLDINANSISSKIAGSGDINIEGKTNSLDTTIVGSGDFVSKRLQANNVTVVVTGSGDASVFANTKIEAKVVGSGDIIVYGNPENEITRVTGSGDISIR